MYTSCTEVQQPINCARSQPNCDEAQVSNREWTYEYRRCAPTRALSYWKFLSYIEAFEAYLGTSSSERVHWMVVGIYKVLSSICLPLRNKHNWLPQRRLFLYPIQRRFIFAYNTISNRDGSLV